MVGLGTITLISLLQASAVVPGGCTAPAAANVGSPGCYLSVEVPIEAAPGVLYWHISRFGDEAAARAEAGLHQWATVVTAHGRVFLYVLSGRPDEPVKGEALHRAGPFALAEGKPVVARFMESWFPPGMKTRVHSHPGPEAFYVIEGEQCVETPEDRHLIGAGESYIVRQGPHLQAAPKGRRSVVLILAAADMPWMKMEPRWVPTGFCGG